MKLPKGWIQTRLGNVTESEKGKKPKTLGEKDSQKVYPYIDIRAFEKGEIRQYTDGEKCRLCKKDDILLVWDGARSGLVGKAIDGAIGSTLARIWSEVIENNYLFYFLKSKFNDLNTNTKGIGIPHINPNYLWNNDFDNEPFAEKGGLMKVWNIFGDQLEDIVEELNVELIA